MNEMDLCVSSSLKLVLRKDKPNTLVRVEDLEVGGKGVVIIAGPCSVEDRSQLLETAMVIKAAGGHMLRGGAFKPRTSPYSFQGLGEEGLKLLAEVKMETGLPVVTEVISPQDVGLVLKYADILQIGSRNMHNFALLKAVGHTNKPVMLKRGLSATVNEWLNAAEYILNGGNPNVILCERGIRTFEPLTRFTLDLSAVPAVKILSHLPVIVDPSHGTGRRSLISSMCKAAVASGADGLIIEVHPKPEEALSDGPQSLLPEQFKALMKELKSVAESVGRSLK